MARTRIFIGVDINEEIRENVVDLQTSLGKAGASVKWVEADNMHVTLLFIGEVEDRELHAVCRAVRDVAATQPPFALSLAGVGAFPNLRRPKIVWAGVKEGKEALQQLYDDLETKLLDLGCYRKEERGYTPHLTLGRVKGESDGYTLSPQLTKFLGWDGGRTMVDEVLVYSSELDRDGPVYTVLGRGELTGLG